MIKEALALMNPTRWAILGGVLLALAGVVGGTWVWHGVKVKDAHDEAFKAGQKEVQDRWDTAVNEAATIQSEQNAAATDTFTNEREVVRVEYVDRIKEVKTYVPTAGTDCPADAGFLRRYNAHSSAAGETPN